MEKNCNRQKWNGKLKGDNVFGCHGTENDFDETSLFSYLKIEVRKLKKYRKNDHIALNNYLLIKFIVKLEK